MQYIIALNCTNLYHYKKFGMIISSSSEIFGRQFFDPTYYLNSVVIN